MCHQCLPANQIFLWFSSFKEKQLWSVGSMQKLGYFPAGSRLTECLNLLIEIVGSELSILIKYLNWEIRWEINLKSQTIFLQEKENLLYICTFLQMILFKRCSHYYCLCMVRHVLTVKSFYDLTTAETVWSRFVACSQVLLAGPERLKQTLPLR